MKVKEDLKFSNPNLSTSFSCVACKGNLSFFGNRLSYKYYLCSRCNTIQIFPIPIEHDLKLAYTLSNYIAQQKDECSPDSIRKSSKPYYESLIRILKDWNVSGLVVDYGCGWGGLCESLIKNGFDSIGFEISQTMIFECKKRRLPVEDAQSIKLSDYRGKVKAILLCGVFEHLSNHDTFLKEVYQGLDDNGLLITLQPTSVFAKLLGNISRLGFKSIPLPSFFSVFDPPWHTALFSVQGMKQIASRNGFYLLEIRKAPQGKLNGIQGLIQFVVGSINKVGWKVLNIRWPLVVAHIFVLKKAIHKNY